MGKVLDGIKFGFGFILVISFIFGIVFAIGFHSAEEILGGTFSGNFIFEDNVTFNGNVSGISSGGVPSDAMLTFPTSCPLGYTIVGGINMNKVNPSGIFASSIHPTHVETRIHDGSTATFWSSNQIMTAQEGWIAFQFSENYLINKINLFPYANTHLLIDNFSVYGSLDSTNGVDGSWDLIVSNLDTLEDADTWTNISINNYNSYSWYKLVGDYQYHDTNQYYIQIAEVEFYNGNVVCKKD